MLPLGTDWGKKGNAGDPDLGSPASVWAQHRKQAGNHHDLPDEVGCSQSTPKRDRLGLDVCVSDALQINIIIIISYALINF